MHTYDRTESADRNRTDVATELEEIVICSDNAGAFSNVTQAAFVNMLRKKFPNLTIVKWVFTEAQCGKTFLDTHFAYVSLQIKKAKVDGGILVMDQYGLYDALTYDGGIRATTTLLLKENDCAHSTQELCKDVMSKVNTKGSTEVHDISFFDGKIEWRRHGGLDPFRTFDTKEWAISNDMAGAVIRRKESSNSKPLYFPPKDETNENLASIGMEELKAQHRTFGVALHMAILQAQGDGNAVGDTSDENSSSIRQSATLSTSSLDAAIKGAVDGAPELSNHWAQKKSRQHRKVIQLVLDALTTMYEKGKGVKNKALRYNAERAVSELRLGLINRIWDQRVICSVSKAKALFSTMFRKEKEDNDSCREDAGESLTLQEVNGREMEELEAGAGVMQTDEVATQMVGGTLDDTTNS